MKLLLQLLIVCLPIMMYGQSKSVSISKTNKKTKVTVKEENGHNFSLEYEGEIVLSDDEQDIEEIKNGGYLEIKKSGFGSKRRVYMENENGVLQKTYFVGNQEVPFDPEGRKWLAEILQEVVRTTTLGAEKRVERFYEEGGASLVIDEVSIMKSDHVRSHYLNLLLGYELNDLELSEVLNSVDDIDSDHHRANILIENVERFMGNEKNVSAYITTAGHISSDHHKAEILNAAIRNEDFSDVQIEELFRITKKIDSDHHKANVIQTILEQRELNARNIEFLIDATNEIDSDHHKSETLMKAIGMQGLTDEGYQQFLGSLSNISSDHHKANILSQMLDRELKEGDLELILNLAQKNIGSDHHKSEIISKFVRTQVLTEPLVDQIIPVIFSSNSSHHQGEILREVSKLKLSENSQIKFLKSAKMIDSDHTMSDVLIDFSPQVRRGSENVRAAYIESANYITSSTSKERVMKAIE